MYVLNYLTVPIKCKNLQLNMKCKKLQFQI